MKNTLILAAVMLAALPLQAQEPHVNATTIKDGLYLLKGEGGNVLASAGHDGLLLIDSDYAHYAPAYQRALVDLGQQLPRLLVNTHWHGDHTGGNAYWGEQGTLVVAHDKVRERMSTRQQNKFLGGAMAAEAAAWPVVTYGDAMTLHFNGDTLEVRHFPRGHTDGDSVVFLLNANVVHMGDHYFKDRFPFIDMDSGGSVSGFIANIGGILEMIDVDTVIVPGHGALAGRDDLQRYLVMLRETRAEVAAMRAGGLDLAAMQRRGLDKRWSAWGGGFINEANWIAFLAAD